MYTEAKKKAQRKHYSTHRKDRIEASTKWNVEHPERRRANQHQSLYKESIENKQARLEAQGWKCANQACLKSIDLTTGHQDHNHETNEKRGVLCGWCNTALGFLMDKVEMIEGLAIYRRLFVK
jgi:hypothetical protein